MIPEARRYQTPFCYATFVLVALGCFSLSGCDTWQLRDAPSVSLADKPMPTVVSAQEAIQSPEISRLDLATLDSAEINKVLPAGPQCSFRYTDASPPVLAATVAGTSGKAEGVIKLHGRLIQVAWENTGDDVSTGAVFTADGIKIEVIPDSAVPMGKDRAAKLDFQVQPDFKVGYKGWYRCDTQSNLAATH